MKLISVFGSLRKNLHNNYILDNAEYLGITKTAPIFTMLDFGSYPGLLHTGNTEVEIEVYKVMDDITWKRLDMLEGYPDFYNRMIIETEYGFAWIYYNPLTESNVDSKIVNSGNWIEYENIHNKRC